MSLPRRVTPLTAIGVAVIAALAAAGAEPLGITMKLLVEAVSSSDPPDFITTLAYPYLNHRLNPTG